MLTKREISLSGDQLFRLQSGTEVVVGDTIIRARKSDRIEVLEKALDEILSLAASASADWPGAYRAEAIAHRALERGQQ